MNAFEYARLKEKLNNLEIAAKVAIETLRSENERLRFEMSCEQEEKKELREQLAAKANGPDYYRMWHDEVLTRQALQDQLAAVTKEREHWEATCHAQWENHQAEIAAVKEQLTAGQLDAERYRMHVKLWSERHGVPEDEVTRELDAAIDAQKAKE